MVKYGKGKNKAKKDEFIGKVVLLDTESRWLYVGRLKKITSDYFIMEDVDAHDLTETSTTRRDYLVEIRETGLVANRKLVMVRKEKIVGFSLLEDAV